MRENYQFWLCTFMNTCIWNRTCCGHRVARAMQSTGCFLFKCLETPQSLVVCRGCWLFVVLVVLFPVLEFWLDVHTPAKLKCTLSHTHTHILLRLLHVGGFVAHCLHTCTLLWCQPPWLSHCWCLGNRHLDPLGRSCGESRSLQHGQWPVMTSING